MRLLSLVLFAIALSGCVVGASVRSTVSEGGARPLGHVYLAIRADDQAYGRALTDALAVAFRARDVVVTTDFMGAAPVEEPLLRERALAAGATAILAVTQTSARRLQTLMPGAGMGGPTSSRNTSTAIMVDADSGARLWRADLVSKSALNDQEGEAYQLARKVVKALASDGLIVPRAS